MRRRLASIFCILSLLLCVAAIVGRATIAPKTRKTADTVALGSLWIIEYDSVAVRAEVSPPPYAIIPDNVVFHPKMYEFAGFSIGYVQASQLSEYGGAIPWWAVITIPLVLPAVVGVWRYLKRARPAGHCPKCGYNLTGNTSGVCPECGTPVTVKANNAGQL